MLNHENQQIPQNTSEITSDQEDYLQKTMYLIELFERLQDQIQEIKQPRTSIELIDAISHLFNNQELDYQRNHQACPDFKSGYNLQESSTLKQNSIIQTPSGIIYGCCCHKEGDKLKKYYPTPQALGGHILQEKKRMNKQNIN